MLQASPDNLYLCTRSCPMVDFSLGCVSWDMLRRCRICTSDMLDQITHFVGYHHLRPALLITNSNKRGDYLKH